MARVIIKVGDIFSVTIDAHTKKYFQYVADDATQLSSNVIRVFKKQYAVTDEVDPEAVVKGEIDFYAHCIVKLGVKLGYWNKEGSVNDIGVTEVFFRNTDDYGQKLGEEPIKVSHNWYVWKINDKDFTRVGKLEGAYRQAEIGLVINPADIVNRMRTGQYAFQGYPGF